jgi:hypothetical protein
LVNARVERREPRAPEEAGRLVPGPRRVVERRADGAHGGRGRGILVGVACSDDLYRRNVSFLQGIGFLRGGGPLAPRYREVRTAKSVLP